MLDLWLWLYSQPGFGSRKLVELGARLGISPELGRIRAAVSRIGRNLLVWDKWEEKAVYVQRQLDELGVGIIPWWDTRYPALLREIPDFPAFLFYKGRWDERLFSRTLSVVGTRRITSYGTYCVKSILGPVAEEGISIVSGLAMGVDAESHRSAMAKVRSRPTSVAVLPGGPEDGVPAANRSLYENVCTFGIALWEFLPGTPLSPEMFAVRNRIIAGLSTCTLVIESGESGGSMITASAATEYNRDVAAVPGSILNSSSAGTNKLLREGAHVVRNGMDVLSLLDSRFLEVEGSDDRGSQVAKMIGESFGVDAETAAAVVDDIVCGTMTVDGLVRKVGKSPAEVRVILTKLEVKGILGLESGGIVKMK